ncbi:MAG: dethiobiotin synthase [Thermodesulfobacteriota bacterium]
MRRSFFITGTGTGVGKTFVTAGLARVARDAGDEVGVMKPVETGCEKAAGSLVPRDAHTLKEAALSAAPLDTINPYRFSLPLAPYLAARLEGVQIDPALIKARYDALCEENDVVLVEGAGGLLVPVTGEMTMADVARMLGAPLIIVADSRLGVINHTCLTAECATGRGLAVEGVIMNNTTAPGDAPDRAYNRSEIERLTGLPVFGELPFAGEGLKKDAPFREGGVFESLYDAIF